MDLMAESVTGNPVQWSVHATVNTHMECYNFTIGSRWILEQYCGRERLLFHFYQLKGFFFGFFFAQSN